MSEYNYSKEQGHCADTAQVHTHADVSGEKKKKRWGQPEPAPAPLNVLNEAVSCRPRAGCGVVFT